MASGNASTSTASSAAATPTSSVISSHGWFSIDNYDNFSFNNVSWDSYDTMRFFGVPVIDTMPYVDLNTSYLDMHGMHFTETAHQNNVTALLSIGGWNGCQWCSPLVATAGNRTAFAESLINLTTVYGFDGLEFDWEYPNDPNGSPGSLINANDTVNLYEFFLAIHSLAPNLTLSAAAPDFPWLNATGQPSTNLSGFAKVLDYVAIMNFDIVVPGGPFTGPNAPLYSCGPNATTVPSAHVGVEAWMAAGFPSSKIVLGVPSYGHVYRVTPSDAFSSNGTLALYTNTTTPFITGDSWDIGTLTAHYWALANGTYLDASGNVAPGATYLYDNCTQTPYVYRNDTQAMISLDDATSFRAKGEFVKEQGLGGFAMFDVAGDLNNTLLNAIRDGAGMN